MMCAIQITSRTLIISFPLNKRQRFVAFCCSLEPGQSPFLQFISQVRFNLHYFHNSCNYPDASCWKDLIWNIFPTISLPLSVALTSHRWETAILTCGELFSFRLAWVLSSILTPQSWVPSGFIYIAFTQYRRPAPLTYADLCFSLASVLQLKMSTTVLTLNLGKSVTGSLKPAG